MAKTVDHSISLHIDGLSAGYRRRPAVLKELTARLDPGVVGLLGPNGAGKSTLISVLAGGRRPKAGTAVIMRGGVPVIDRERSRRVSLLPQDVCFPGRFTVRDCLEYVAWLQGVPRAARPAAVFSALATASLEDRADQRVSHLSGGTLRRVGLASAFVNDPWLVLLDEPTSGLDLDHRDAFFADLERQARGERIVLLSSHVLDDVVRVCDRVLVLHAGRVQAVPDLDGLDDDARRRAIETFYRSRVRGAE